MEPSPSPAGAIPELEQPSLVSRAAFLVVLGCFLLSEAALVAAVAHHWIWLAVLLVLIAAHFMHGLGLAFHEATHGLLRENRTWNDADGIAIGALSFLSLSLFRCVHGTHHAFLTTERDEELWPFVKPEMPLWQRRVAAFFELTCGLAFHPYQQLRSFLRKGSTIRNAKIRKRIWTELAIMAVVWLVIFSAVAYWRAWTWFFWLYLGPAALASNMHSWRKYIEHMGLSGTTVNSSTRSIIPPGPLGRALSLTLLNEPYHGVHHKHPGLCQAEVPGHKRLLTPETPAEHPPYQSYWGALLDMVQGLSDPHVGPQWRRKAKPLQVEASTVSTPPQ